MKKIFFPALVLITLIISTHQVKAQAIKLDYIGFSGICSRYSNPFFYGIGYDQNFGDKLSLGLTYKGGYALDDGYWNQEIDYSFLSTDASNIEHVISFSVIHKTSWHEFAYTSKYFFEDNTDGGYFISSGISLLQATNTYQVYGLAQDQVQVPNYQDLSQGLYEQKITLFPVSLDLGGRGAFDGFYFEYYLGMAFLPFGSKKDVEPAFLNNHGVETRFQPVSFHMGLSIGVSWAD